jgi:plastocyanin
MRRVLVISTLIAIATLWSAPPAGAGGGGGGGSLCAGFSDAATIRMLDSCFEGTAHTVSTGETVTLVNDGLMPHTFTAADGSFDSGVLQPGESWDVTFADPGMVNVWCTLHGTPEGQGMAGAVFVDGGALATAVAEERSNAAGWWPASTIGFALLSLMLAVRSFRGRGRAPADEREPQLV